MTGRALLAVSKKVTVLVVLVLGASGLLRADLVYLKDGRQVEGTILEQDRRTVVVQTRFGKVTLKRSQIDRIEVKKTPSQELAERESKLAADHADGWFALALFAAENKLKKDEKRLLQRVLQIDAQHAGANQALGRVQYRGRWMTPVERDRAAKADREAQMREQGLVQHEGRWVTPQEKEQLEKGLVLVDGEWLSEEQARAKEGLIRRGDGWIRAAQGHVLDLIEQFRTETGISLFEGSSRAVTVGTMESADYSQVLADDCQRAIEWCAEQFQQPADLTWLGDRHVFCVVVDNREQFSSFAQFFQSTEKKASRRWADSVARRDGFYWFDPVGTAAVRRGRRILEHTSAHSVHMLGHVLLNRYAYNFRFLPAWLDEGFAVLLEREILGINVSSCITDPGGYATAGLREEKLQPGAAWLEDMIRRIQHQEDPPLQEILQRDITQLTADDVVKSMTVLIYLLEDRPDDFRAFFQKLREVWPPGQVNHRSEEAQAAHRQAFNVLRLTPRQMDQKLREYFAARES
jgi:hypothetical protein